MTETVGMTDIVEMTEIGLTEILMTESDLYVNDSGAFASSPSLVNLVFVSFVRLVRNCGPLWTIWR
jgi:hypothetical protein